MLSRTVTEVAHGLQRQIRGVARVRRTFGHRRSLWRQGNRGQRRRTHSQRRRSRCRRSSERERGRDGRCATRRRPGRSNANAPCRIADGCHSRATARPHDIRCEVLRAHIAESADRGKRFHRQRGDRRSRRPYRNCLDGRRSYIQRRGPGFRIKRRRNGRRRQASCDPLGAASRGSNRRHR